MFSALTNMKQTLAELKTKGSVIEDGNTVALIERIERDLAQIDSRHDFNYQFIDTSGKVVAPTNPVDDVDPNDPNRRVDPVTGESYDPRDVTSDPARKNHPEMDVVNPEKNQSKPLNPDEGPLVAAGGDVGAPYSGGLGTDKEPIEPYKAPEGDVINTSKSVKKTK